MCYIAALIDKSAVLDNNPLRLEKEVTFLKIRAKVQDLSWWFRWGAQFQQKQLIFSLLDKNTPKRSDYLERAANFNYVELDVQTDLKEELLQRIPVSKRILCWQGWKAV